MCPPVAFLYSLSILVQDKFWSVIAHSTVFRCACTPSDMANQAHELHETLLT